MLITKNSIQEKNVKRQSPDLNYLRQYISACFFEYGGVTNVDFFEPSTNDISLMKQAQEKIQSFFKDASFMADYILLSYKTIPTRYAFGSIMIPKEEYNIGVDRIVLINAWACDVSDIIFKYIEVSSKCENWNGIWLTFLDMLTMEITGRKQYIRKTKGAVRTTRAIELEKELITKGWNIQELANEFIHCKNDQTELKKCFAYYIANEFSNAGGHIIPKKESLL